MINLDESALGCGNFQRRSWSPSGSHHVEVTGQRLQGMHMVAAISSRGRSWFCVGSGNNNSATFLLFLLRLCKELDDECADWRQKVVVQLDNAAYHRSKQCMDAFASCAIPVFLQGPYSFRTAPVELVFAQVKKRNLLPDHPDLASRKSTA